MGTRDESTAADGVWRDEDRLPLSELAPAVATSSTEGQADDVTGGEAGSEAAFGDEPFAVEREPDGEQTRDEREHPGQDPDPTSAAGRAMRPSPQGRIGPV